MPSTADHTIFRRTLTRATRSAVVWGAAFGWYVAIQAITFAHTYPTVRSRQHFADVFGANSAIDAIAGPGRDLSTVGGFVAWKCLIVLSVTGAIWGLLTATRLLRGEEGAGRTELLASGPVDRSGVAGQSLAAVAVAGAVFLVTTAAIVVGVGRLRSVHIGPTECLVFALTVVSPTLVFLGVGAVTSQLSTTRRQAAGIAGALLGLAFVVRMVADAGVVPSWFDWLSPFGWVEEVHALTAERPAALAPALACICLAVPLTLMLARRRDLGSGLLSGRTTREQARPIRSLERLSATQAGPSIAAWIAGIAAFGLIVGLIAKDGGAALATSSSLEKVLARLGVAGPTTAAYIAFSQVVTALGVSLLVASLVHQVRSEESSGRLEALLASPVSRLRWYAGRAGLAAGGAIVAGVAAGLLTWVGAAAEHAHLDAGAALAAGANAVPQALCVLAAGLLAFGMAPRTTTAVTYGMLSWSFLVDLLGGGLQLDHWLLDMSPVHEMAAVPLVGLDWSSAAVLVAIAAVATSMGGVGFAHRDLELE